MIAPTEPESQESTALLAPEVVMAPGFSSALWIVDDQGDADALINAGFPAIAVYTGAALMDEDVADRQTILVVIRAGVAGADWARSILEALGDLLWAGEFIACELPRDIGSLREAAQALDPEGFGPFVVTLQTFAKRTTITPEPLPFIPEVLLPEESAPVRPPEPTILPLSDQTNAETLVQWYGANMRYCAEWNYWLIWDGKRWRIDNTGQVMRWAKETVKRLAAQLPSIQGEAEARTFLAHIKKSLSCHALEAMVKLAQSEPGIAMPSDAFDRDVWLLNVANGTLDLRTGALQPYRREDFITKLAPVEFNETAECPAWEKFLQEIYASDRDLVDFDQKALGYSLTGNTREQCMFLCHGSGANGKSVKLTIVMEMMGSGEYATKTSIGAFTESELRYQQASTEYYLAKLHNVRFVWVSEGKDGSRLSESLIKDATGGDPINARHPYGRPFSFVPRFKLWFATNHEPVITGTDAAIWRRTRKIPFTVSFLGREDTTLIDRLRQELPGILRWAVMGCLRWQTNGLTPPKAVQDATNTYRAAMDVVGRFLEECCALIKAAKVESGVLYQAYVQWSEQNGERPLTQRKLAERLQGRGLRNDEQRSATGRRLWVGIGLKQDI